MIKVVMRNQARDLYFRGTRSIEEPESEDGMRRASSFTVSTKKAFIFANEQKIPEGYSYDLQVTEQDTGYSPTNSTYDYTASEEEFMAKSRTNFDYVVYMLWLNGMTALNYPAYVYAESKLSENCGSYYNGVFTPATSKYVVEIKFQEAAYPIQDGDEVVTADELFGQFSQIESNKEYLMALAIGDQTTLFKKLYKVELGSLSTEFHKGRKLFEVKQPHLDDLLERKIIIQDDIRQAMLSFLSRMETQSSYNYMSTEGLEEIILSLPQEQIGKYLEYCKQTRENLELLRTYCPKRIEWRNVSLEDMYDSDLDLMIDKGEYAYTKDQWAFIDHCMENPDLERKVVANAYILGYCDINRIVRQLNVTTTTNVLRTVSQHLAKKEGSVDISRIKDLFKADFTELSKNDYEAWLSIARRIKLNSCGEENEMAAFLLTIGCIAQVDEAELKRMLQEEKIPDRHVELGNKTLRQVYEKFNFAPGLAWAKEDDERREAQERRLAEERAASNEQVVKFVRESGKIAVCVSSEKNSMGYVIRHPETSERIGVLQTSEERVVFIEGKRNDYLVNVNRAKSPKNGILHIDILEYDKGYVIGPKGSKLNAAAQHLRDLGCQVERIMAHGHDTL